MASGSSRRQVVGLNADSHTSLELDRVPKKSLKAADTCPICNNSFLEGKHPSFLSKSVMKLSADIFRV